MLEPVAKRFRQSDMVQLGTLFFSVVLFSFFVAWPTRPAANNTWFAVSQVRLLSLALLALGYGAHVLGQARRQQRGTLGALLCLALLSSPLEIAAYALSFPELPLFYSLGLGLLDTAALFGLGLALAAVLHFLRLSALLPLAVPALLVGFVFVDIGLGVRLTSPLAALSGVAPWHLGLMGALSLATLAWLSRPDKTINPDAEEAQS